MDISIKAAVRGVSTRAFFARLRRLFVDPRTEVPDLSQHLLRDAGLDPRDRDLRRFMLPSEDPRRLW